jgi:futalosine hydrolase
MNILVTFPTDLEASLFLKKSFKNVDVAVTGVGVPSTIYQLQKILAKTSYQLIIQAGICGSFNLDELPIGASCSVEKDVFADLGIIANDSFLSINELGFAHKDETNFKDGWLVNNGAILDKIDLPRCNAITVNTIVENNQQSILFIKKYTPQIESMEGAALHYVCLLQQVSFVQLRTVSNAVGEKDKSKWNFDLAIQNMTDALLNIISIAQKT